ncbi:hypothetical protein ACFOOM_12340 [Streptomyces echinoruber]|uniref:Uncharacterized protein n=1 Tax=Streptomyces echinoruber TaxID=68898 RepID=A0A918RIE6_9ACTN|nr:hypothetical protein [Streptomyces echinoruber]GHA01200.1 hypothetical protein GCM10010389_45660 [Streptomyces echinoruber]
MNTLLTRRITVADYLTQRGLPADWRYASPLGRAAAAIYRQLYRREPARALRWINGHVRQVCAYDPSEAHVLTAAWEQYGCTAGLRPVPTARFGWAPVDWVVGIDAMRWRPTDGPMRSHP